MDTNEFIRAWIGGALGRKVKHSNYYLKTFTGLQYLCHLGTGGQSWPHVIGVKIQGPNGPILIIDTRNKDEFLDGINWEGYEARFSTLHDSGKDITKIKVIDSKTIGEVTFYLFEIDASYYYTDFKTVNYAKNVGDFLNFKDVEGTKAVLKLFVAKGRPSTMKEARGSDFPAGVPEDAKIAGKLVLIPEALDATIDPSILRAAMWTPNPVGFRIPNKYTSYSGLDRDIRRLANGEKVKEYLLKKKESEELATRLALYKDEEDEHNEALRLIKWRIMQTDDRLNALGIVAEPDDRWQSGEVRSSERPRVPTAPIYVKGKIVVSIRDEETHSYNHPVVDERTIDLGDQWHRVGRRGK